MTKPEILELLLRLQSDSKQLYDALYEIDKENGVHKVDIIIHALDEIKINIDAVESDEPAYDEMERFRRDAEDEAGVEDEN